MYELAVSEANLLVIKNLYEQKYNDSDMIDLDDIDSNEFDEILAKNLPEAINAVHSASPVQLLDGELLGIQEANGVDIKAGVLAFDISKDLLRLVAFRAADSQYVITQPVAEASFEGRMQLNPYTQGTPGRPRLVLMQGKTGDGKSSFRYYTVSGNYDDPAKAIARFEYLSRYSYDGSTTSYKVAENVVENIINYLTAMILVTYGNVDGAAYYFQRSGLSNTNEQS